MIVAGTLEQQTEPHCEACAAADAAQRAGRNLTRARPDLRAGGGVQREQMIVGGQQIHDAVDHQRRRAEAAFAGRKRPSDGQMADVLGVDLIQRLKL